jgi:choline dehydrogenase-like flavoprotein
MLNDYDVVIIGAGAAGGIVAAVLAEAGRHVLLLERGGEGPSGTTGRDHLRNQRLSVYGHNAGPNDDHPRVATTQDGHSHLLRPHELGYENNAACVGGGTRVYGGMAWRFMPQDFQMATTYGVPPGSSLADWPIGYDDLEPFYERAEWEIGVAGTAGADKFAAPRKKVYPLPPIESNPERIVLERGAAVLGLNTFPTPLLINTIPYNGRPACGRCGMCVGFACPTDGKNGVQNTMVPRAVVTGRCTLITSAMVQRIHIDERDRATGVSFFVHDELKTVTVGAVVCSAGAIESARLLLNSRTSRHPGGLGNDFDQVGRNLQGHIYNGAYGVMPDPIFDGRGPGVSIASTQFNHDNPGIIGGGLLTNEFIRIPAVFVKWAMPPWQPRWGVSAKKYVKENYRRTIRVQGPIQDIPNSNARVTLHPFVRDRWGIPVAHLTGTTHPESIRTSEFLRRRAEDWLTASGAKTVWSYPSQLGLSGGQHQAGTCRMGTDPCSSVTDSWGRVHGHENLFVMDASIHVTNGGFNPVLTIMALAFRNASHLAAAGAEKR